MTKAEARQLLVEELWHQGAQLEWLLDEGQRAAWTAFLGGDGAAVWLWARQRGKSFAALSGADAFARAEPGRIIRYAALTAKSASAIVVPTLGQLYSTCPESLRPIVKPDRGTVEWPNGSILTWAGTDNEQFDRLRGPRAHLILLDESAFYADLERVEAALLPQLTTTAGRVLYLSSPPESPAHPFVQRYRAAKANGRGLHATIWDNPRLGKAGAERVLRREAERMGLTLEQFVLTTYCRREFFAEIVTEESRAALPAWTDEAQAACVVDVARQPHFDGYVGVDLGFSPDPHGVLFAWHDVAAGHLVVEDELELRGATVADLATAIKQRERALWGVDRYEGTVLGASDWSDVPPWLMSKVHSRAPRQPFLRVGDDDKLVLAEMAQSHGLAVLPTRKDDKHLAVDAVNQLIAARRIRINPRCKRLLEEMRTTLWNRTRSEWERTDKDHGDLVDALVYLVRNIRWNRDCRPDVTQWQQAKPSGLDTWDALLSRRR